MHMKTLLTILFLCLWTTASLGAPATGNYELHSTLTFQAEYNDNVNEEQDDRDEDIILSVTPAITFDYFASLFDLNLSYALTYNDYLKDTDGDEVEHDLYAFSNIRLVENLLHIDISDTYTQVYRDVARGEVGADDTLEDQIEQNTFTVSPYLLFNFWNRLDIKTGYLFTDIRYFDDDDDDGEEAVDKYSHTGFAEAAYALSPAFSLTGQYTYTDLNADVDGENDDGYTQHTVTGGFVYEYGPESSVYASVGPAWTDFDDGDSTTDLFWEAGLTHTFRVLVVNLITYSSYAEDPDEGTFIRQSTATAEAVLPFSRGETNLLLGYTDFDDEDGDLDDQEEERYFGGWGLSYKLTDRLTSTVGVNAEQREYENGDTTLVSPAVGLSYLMGWDITASLMYNYIWSDSDDREDDDYHVNRVIFAISKKLF